MLRVDSGHGTVAVDSTWQIVHHIEDGANDCLIFAEVTDARHRHVGVDERAHHPVFAIYRMRRRQKLAARFLAHHIGTVRCLDMEGRIGLSALELAHDAIAVEAR